MPSYASGVEQGSVGLSYRGAITVAVLAAVLVAGTSHPVQAATEFEQDHRANSITLQTGTDTFAPSNAFGGAFGSIAHTTLQESIDASVQDGSLTLLLQMPGLSDLSGMSSDPFSLGVVNGTPFLPEGNPTPYDGTADLDWWYSPSALGISEDGTALHQLPASFATGTLTAGPGTIELAGTLPTSSLEMWGTNIEADTGDSSVVTQSSNGFPPGYLPDDGVSGVSSFGSMTDGRLAGNITAASLAETQIPPSLTGGGISSCAQAYTAANSMLDLIVGGCSIIGTAQVHPTQPDKSLTPGDVYTFQTDPTTKQVTSCTRNAQPAVLSTCLSEAAYSVYLTFTTNRVIVRKPCPPGSYSDSGSTPCTDAAPGFYAEGYGNTSQTPCPEGTSSGPGASSCDEITVTTVDCSKNPVQIGILTTCEGAVTNASESVATGALDWSGPDGDGIFSSDGCTLTAGLDGAACSVTYRPAPGTAGTHVISAAYGGDADHAPSDDELALKVVRRKTSTTVACKPMTIEHGKSTSCVATVADTSSGKKVSPTGKVEWSAKSSYGSFSSKRCTLARRDGAKRCGVKFTTRKSVRGKIKLTAAYLGDKNHSRSSKSVEPKVI